MQTRHATPGRSDRTRASAGDATTTLKTVIRTQARAALVGLGWKPAIACAAIDGAAADLGAPTLEELIREALPRCPKPLARVP